jgi:hypothetical protein
MCLCAMLAGAVAIAQQTPNVAAGPDPGTCTVTDRPEMSWDTRWRVQSNEGLDCLVAIVSRALGEGTGAGEGDEVSIPRQDLERIRTLALLSKDAAQRIGR